MAYVKRYQVSKSCVNDKKFKTFAEAKARAQEIGGVVHEITYRLSSDRTKMFRVDARKVY